MINAPHPRAPAMPSSTTTSPDRRSATSARRRLRLLFVLPSLGMGGAERHAVTLLAGIDRSRYEPSVVCIDRRGALAPELASSIPVTSLGVGGRASRLPWALARLWWIARPGHADVVITTGFNADVVGRIAGRARRRIVISWKHNCGHVGHYGVRDRIGERILGRWTDRYFGVSYGQMRYLTDYLGIESEKIRIIHNGVLVPSEPRPPAHRSGEEKVLAAVAVLREEKDHVTLLRAVRLLVDRMPKVRLLIIGDGPERDRLVALAEELGITDHVTFLGQRHDVADLLEGADVVTLSSYTVECFPFSVLEAMAAGKPVVCTAVGGIPEMVDEGVTGFLVPPRAPVALADRLERVLGDEELAKRMGAAGLAKLTEQFQADRMVTLFERELEDLVRAR
jgi:glycosyltransferase involved in cell wall biosynthesis